MNLKQNTTGGWDVDKRIPLAVIVAMMIQTLILATGASWFFADISIRILNAEKDVATALTRLDDYSTRMRGVEQENAAQKERIASQQEVLGRLAHMLEVIYRRGLRTDDPDGDGW